MSDLSSVKAGDKVLIRSSGYYQPDVVTEVTHVTPKQFSCGRDKFRIKDGMAIGRLDSVFTEWVVRFATEDDLNAVEHTRLAKLISEHREHHFKKLTLDHLKKINQWLSEAKATP